jgi:hypothetical protein
MKNTKSEYQIIISSLKRRKKGATAADICAATALPLAAVDELLPKAADEYLGHLRVTQSGEILYYFPNGFTSRFRGLSAAFKNAANKLLAFLKTASVYLFKFWIMVMLIGYFILFLALALASVFLMAAGKSSGKGRRGSSVNIGLFNIIWRLWFYSELTGSKNRLGRGKNKKKNARNSLQKSIFSFVFGEVDPNKNWEDQETKAVISYIQANSGIISLAEYMAFTGRSGTEAETGIISFCSKFEGSPEVTDEGTIVYRFEKLMLKADSNKNSELIPPVKRLKKFSDNSKTMNGWFAVINTVNLIFGSYFLSQSINTGQLISEIQYKSASSLYAYTHYFLSYISNTPHNFIGLVLGLIPLIFTIFFWSIPIIRFFKEKKENKNIKLENFKRFSFNKIFSSPLNIDINSFNPNITEYRPDNLEEAKDRVVKDIGSISSPQIEIAQDGKTIYSFSELDREKKALEKYRKTADNSKSKLGEIVFDSNS